MGLGSAFHGIAVSRHDAYYAKPAGDRTEGTTGVNELHRYRTGLIVIFTGAGLRLREGVGEGEGGDTSRVGVIRLAEAETAETFHN